MSDEYSFCGSDEYSFCGYCVTTRHVGLGGQGPMTITLNFGADWYSKNK